MTDNISKVKIIKDTILIKQNKSYPLENEFIIFLFPNYLKNTLNFLFNTFSISKEERLFIKILFRLIRDSLFS